MKKRITSVVIAVTIILSTSYHTYCQDLPLPPPPHEPLSLPIIVEVDESTSVYSSNNAGTSEIDVLLQLSE